MRRQIPESLLDFQRLFPDEEACVHYLFRLRWPDGFACSSCGDTEKPYWIRARRFVMSAEMQAFLGIRWAGHYGCFVRFREMPGVVEGVPHCRHPATIRRHGIPLVRYTEGLYGLWNTIPGASRR